MSYRIPSHVLLVIFLVGLISCQKASQESGETQALPDRDPALAEQLVKEGALLLDVRTPEEHGEIHIEAARLIPLGELPTRVDEVLELQGGNKDKPIVVHCQSGRRAARAKDLLLQQGFTQVTNMGGVDDWPGPKKSTTAPDKPTQ